MIVKGEVVHGKRLGGALGFPTANVKLAKEAASAIPSGVYAARVTIGEACYKGIANVGNHPTVGTAVDNLLEVHIFDFNKNIYGVHIVVELHSFIRAEKKFNDVEELKKAIKNDISVAKSL